MTAMIKREAPVMQVGAYAQLAETIAACQQLGKALAATYSLNSPMHGEIMMLTCLSEDISVSEYHKRYHPDGSMRAASIQASFMLRGGTIQWEDFGDDGKLASAMFSHPTLMPEPRLITYTHKNAVDQVGDKMNKTGSNWKTNLGAMLRAALIRKAVKIIDPGVVTGYDSFNDMDPDPIIDGPVVQTAEELQARRAELLAGQHGGGEEVIMDAIVEEPTEEPPFMAQPTADPYPTTEPEPDPEPEPEPETVATGSIEPVTDPCTIPQLKQLSVLGQQLPSTKRKSEFMDIQEVLEGICIAAKVKQPRDMSVAQADELLANWEGLIAELAKK